MRNNASEIASSCLKFEDVSLNSVLGNEAPTAQELPCLQSYDPVLALTKLS